MRALTAICQAPWAITEEALQTILEIAARENPDPEMVAAKLGRPLDNTREVTYRDGVATIPVTGPIFRYADLFTQISGATSIEGLATDLNVAINDPAVKAILLNIDSPGGEANGTSELAEMIYEARGTKPITAYVGGMGASAAYWIASAADEIVTADIALLGSIGVVAAYRDPKADRGKLIEFVSSQSPNKLPDPSTDKGRQQIQTMIDDMASVFVDTVARNRGVDSETVLSTFGQGGMFVGQKAIDAGLADALGSYESTLTSLVSRSTMHNPTLSGTLPALHVPLAISPTAGALAADHSTPSQEEIMSNADTTVAEPQATTAVETNTELLVELAQLRAERDDMATANKANAERIAALERENRRREFSTLANGWFGATEQHVDLMERLSAEDRAFYAENQDAVAEQLRQSKLFSEAGIAGAPTSGNAVDGFTARVAAVQASEKIDYASAATRVAGAEPELYAAYQAEMRTRR